jgi:hypothetical protein
MSSKGGEIMGRMNSIQRISAQSLMMLQPRGENSCEKSADRSLRELLREHSQTPISILSPLFPIEKKQESSVIEEQETNILSSDPTARREAAEGMIPIEITVIDESGGMDDDYRAIGGVDMKLNEAQYEAREYFQPLKSSKDEVKTLSKDLKKSREQVQALTILNKAMLDKLKANEANVDTYAILKQENTLLKTCFFLSMIFVMCGGRTEFIALVICGWTFADAFV